MNQEDFLMCAACGNRVIVEGRWANAKIICMECGLVRSIRELRDEMENLKQKWIEDFYREDNPCPKI